MKKILLLMALFLILCLMAAGIFIATFDPDRYRPMVVRKMEEALGRPVELGKISLAWHGGLGLSLENFALPAAGGQNPPLRVERAYVLLKLAPLLNRDLRIGSIIVVHPEIEISRGAGGELTLAGFGPSRGPAGAAAAAPIPSAAPPPRAPAAALSFLIDQVEVRDGRLRLRDQAARPPVSLELRDIDITLRDVSLTGAIPIKARAAALGDSQNIKFEGKLSLPFGEKKGWLEQVRLTIDLDPIRSRELMTAVPALAEIGVAEGLKGNLSLSADKLPLDPEGLGQAAAKIEFRDGHIRLAALTAPIEAITADAMLQGDGLVLNRLAASYLGAKIEASGTAAPLSGDPNTQMKAQLENLKLEELAPPLRRGDPYPTGIVNLTFEGTAKGKTGPAISRTITGRGFVRAENAAIVNLNVLREVLGALSMIPGLEQRLSEQLPEEYKEKLKGRDTLFAPVEIPFSAAGGAFHIPQILIRSESFAVVGAARAGLNGAIAAQIMLVVDSELSSALIQSVEELRYLADPDGRISIPLIVQGVAPHVRIFPDLQYVATRLAVIKGRELLTDLLEKKLGGGQGEGSATSGEAAGSASSSDPLAGLVQDLFS